MLELSKENKRDRRRKVWDLPLPEFILQRDPPRSRDIIEGTFREQREHRAPVRDFFGSQRCFAKYSKTFIEILAEGFDPLSWYYRDGIPADMAQLHAKLNSATFLGASRRFFVLRRRRRRSGRFRPLSSCPFENECAMGEPQHRPAHSREIEVQLPRVEQMFNEKHLTDKSRPYCFNYFTRCWLSKTRWKTIDRNWYAHPKIEKISQ